MTILLEVAPGGIAVVAAVVFFLVFIGLAWFVFKMLKKSVKMAVRVAIAAAILAVAVAVSGYFLFFGNSKSPGPAPRAVPAR